MISNSCDSVVFPLDGMALLDSTPSNLVQQKRLMVTGPALVSPRWMFKMNLAHMKCAKENMTAS